MINMKLILHISVQLALLSSILPVCAADKKSPGAAISIYPGNPYYFQDARGKPMVLIGDYTWGTFSDVDFDYTKMFDSLKKRGLNVARVWLWWGCEEITSDPIPARHFEPFLREGPGTANDGRPKYNLDKFNPAFFARLDAMCASAQKRGITLQLIMMDAWMIKHDYLWKLHAFNRNNNVNGVDGDPRQTSEGTDGQQGFCSMGNPKALKYQKTYIRKVIETTNKYGNIYYEIANENYYNEEWELTLCRFIKETESKMPKQHMTIRLDFPSHSYVVQSWDPGTVHKGIMEKRGLKVPLIFDTDWTINDNDDEVRKSAWTAIASGGHFNYMDDSMEFRTKPVPDKGAVLHKQIDHLAKFVRNIKPWDMKPDDSMVRSGSAYVLAGNRIVFAYLPSGGKAEIDLPNAGSKISAKWFDPRTGNFMPRIEITGKGITLFTAPDGNDWALLIKY
ncbi:MAG: putative collagen-binding domain-containing protein [Armatimonadota bacterium]